MLWFVSREEPAGNSFSGELLYHSLSHCTGTNGNITPNISKVILKILHHRIAGALKENKSLNEERSTPGMRVRCSPEQRTSISK